MNERKKERKKERMQERRETTGGDFSDVTRADTPICHVVAVQSALSLVPVIDRPPAASEP